VNYVINYDLPDIDENYVHRVGRTGRGMEKGIAVSFCATEEKPVLEEIQKFLGKPIQVLEIEKDEYKMTLALTEEPGTNWRKLIEDHEAELAKKRKKKGKK
jgi:ATP-dependent RNA helicase RhlE